ncbi:RnfABCDGE type electron transport complex subunit B [Pseudothauera nasutitermitis]|uniref:Ion-translocating oxidoreductase complex subunit B n=1 Tax=Pseudothauera nasutitermitis TaxID=2565930 RepID=A0A4S4B136_9RHOO|nr:RnfABCDGE type electron transport complex subunit B [Pseudothauera nasutitermitis]THF64598.1 RnfABCDGE type electron transport complex subunit B [Pseudothauera nasutitermitis]
MLGAILSLSLLGVSLGLVLGLAARKFRVESGGIEAELQALMPGSNCGQCGYPGCAGAAAALARGEAAVTCCPPGGKALAETLAARLGVSLDASAVAEELPRIAGVQEEICIGCTKCFKVCPTDAVLGAAKQIHVVIREACTGCAKCENTCPTGAIMLTPVPVTLQTWVWPRPAATPSPESVLAGAGAGA